MAKQYTICVQESLCYNVHDDRVIFSSNLLVNDYVQIEKKKI